MERVHLITKALEAPSFRVSQLLAVWSSPISLRENLVEQREGGFDLEVMQNASAASRSVVANGAEVDPHRAAKLNQH